MSLDNQKNMVKDKLQDAFFAYAGACHIDNIIGGVWTNMRRNDTVRFSLNNTYGSYEGVSCV